MLALFNFIKSLILNVLWNCFMVGVLWFYYKMYFGFIFNGWDRPIINSFVLILFTVLMIEILKRIFKGEVFGWNLWDKSSGSISTEKVEGMGGEF